MPISIPVIKMIEIGAGGGSIAWVDAMGRIQTGPESAASEPGPACYQRGGDRPAITDADLVLGKLDPHNFAGGKITLSVADAEAAIEFVTWSVKVQDVRPAPARVALDTTGTPVAVETTRDMFDPSTGKPLRSRVVERLSLSPGDRVAGPAVIAERETSTIVTAPFDAIIQPDGTILLVRTGA